MKAVLVAAVALYVAIPVGASVQGRVPNYFPECEFSGFRHDRVEVSGTVPVEVDVAEPEGEVVGVWFYLARTTGPQRNRDPFEIAVPIVTPPYRFDYESTDTNDGDYHLIARTANFDDLCSWDAKPVRIRNR